MAYAVRDDDDIAPGVFCGFGCGLDGVGCVEHCSGPAHEHVLETTDEARDEAEMRGDAFYEREELARAARAYRGPVASYGTKEKGAFPLVAAKKLSARAWLRLGLSLRALSEADEPRFAAGYQNDPNVYLGADEPYEYNADDEAACYRNGLRRAKPRPIELKVHN